MRLTSFTLPLILRSAILLGSLPPVVVQQDAGRRAERKRKCWHLLPPLGTAMSQGKARSISGAPAAPPYQYAALSRAEETDRLEANRLREARRLAEEQATAEALLAAEKAARDATIQRLIDSAAPSAADDDPALEAKLAQLEQRLDHRAELFAMRGSGDPEGEAIYSSWRSQELYRLDCLRLAQEAEKREAAEVQARAVEMEAVKQACRQWLHSCVDEIDWVLHQREAEAERVREAAIEALLRAEAEKRIAARDERETEAAQRYKEREAWYFEVAGDELMRRVRQAARQRVEDEAMAEIVRQEAELDALEAKFQGLLQPKVSKLGVDSFCA